MTGFEISDVADNLEFLRKENKELKAKMDTNKTSNLEAKTLAQILQDSKISYEFNGWAGDSQLILSQKYVAEVFVQKEIAELQRQIDVEHSFLSEARTKIEAAKQALDDYCEGCSKFTEKTFECTLKKTSSCPVLKVRNALLIPRSDEQKQGRNFGQSLENGQGIPDVECVNSTAAKAPDQDELQSKDEADRGWVGAWKRESQRKEPQIHGLPVKQVLKEVAKGFQDCEGEEQK